jgi:hypothetical protein
MSMATISTFPLPNPYHLHIMFRRKLYLDRNITSFHSSLLLKCMIQLISYGGRAIAQVVSRRPPTTAAWVRAQVRSCGICGARFLGVLHFPLPILIPATAPHSSSIIWGCYNRPISGLRTNWTQSHLTPRN